MSARARKQFIRRLAARTAKKVIKVQVVKPSRRKAKRGPKLGALLKPKKLVKLRYVDTITLNAGAAAVVAHTFRATSIFDPDRTGTGHQPLLHDTYALLYGSYRVISSTIRCTPVASTASTVVPNFWGVFTDEDSVLDYTLATAVIEDKVRTKDWRMDAGGVLTMQGNGRRTRPMMASFNAKRRLSKEGQVETTLFGANAANFATNDFIIWSGSVLGNDPGILSLLIEIEYICELTDPINVAQS